MSTLTRPSPVLVLNERGGPVPPSDILARLKAYEPALSLRWMPNFAASTWAITWEWKLSDLRWARVQSGEVPREMAYDIIGYLPPDCPADQAAAYIEKSLKDYPREEINRLRATVTQHNDVELPKQQVAALVTDTLDDTSRQSRAPKGQIISIPKSDRTGWGRKKA